MFQNILQTVKNSPFSSPFQAQCDDGLRINPTRSIAAAAIAEGDSCAYGDAKFFALCGLGGILSCGVTHTAVVPLDLVKCRMQVDANKYGNLIKGFKVTVKEGGLRELGKGWAPTAIGYSMQGLCKFGFYEVFKSFYSDIIGEEMAYQWRTTLYLAASASAEFFADIALCPMEAVKVRIQTQPGFANTLREGVPKLMAEEGLWGFYKGIVPLWGRQIPYTMMKFACFERTVEAIYKFVVPKARENCSKGEQLVVTFMAGYIAGIFCAIVSHPADTIVSKLNQQKGSTFVQIAKSLGFAEGESCEYGSAKFFALCGFGGILSCGITHTAVVPLDLVKCRMQVDPGKYGNIIKGFQVTLKESGIRELGKGWAPTFFGYSMQGLGKFGFYEIFKVIYSEMLGEENAYLWRTSLYLAASASAEFFADIALCPMEAVKVRIQTQPGWANTLREGVPKLMAEEGLWGFYKGIVPLWGRQIPYTMMKFACFERTVEALYKYVVPKPRSECSKGEQLIVTFIAGYIAGVFCAIVSHPADTIVSKLNQQKGSTFFEIGKNLGFYGMWKGLFPRIIMIGTLTALQWFIYDSVKVYFRMPRPPPPEMPESLKRKLEAKNQ